MKKVLSTILALLLVLSYSNAAESKKKIGIIQYVQHIALDSARDGFVKALEDNGYIDGQNIEIDLQNAQGDGSNLTSISDRFIANKTDLVLAIATPSAQSIAGATQTIPILGTAITDYISAKLAKTNDVPGGNVSGTSDMNPVKEQIALLAKLAPQAKTIGLIYSSNEDNSILQANIAKTEIEALGLNYVEVTVTNSNEVAQAMQQLLSKSDAIYIPTDNILASSMPIVYDLAVSAKKVVVPGEIGMAMAGGAAALGINYYNLGYQTGLMAKHIILGEDISTMSIQTATEFEDVINKTFCDEAGIKIPDDMQQYAKEMDK